MPHELRGRGISFIPLRLGTMMCDGLLEKLTLIHKQNVLYNTGSSAPIPIITRYNKITTPPPPLMRDIISD